MSDPGCQILDISWIVPVLVYGSSLSLKSIEATHSSCWREVLMVSGVSILNFFALRKRFSLLRSRIGVQ